MKYTVYMYIYIYIHINNNNNNNNNTFLKSQYFKQNIICGNIVLIRINLGLYNNIQEIDSIFYIYNPYYINIAR